jgi:hypothetical protein
VTPYNGVAFIGEFLELGAIDNLDETTPVPDKGQSEFRRVVKFLSAAE